MNRSSKLILSFIVLCIVLLAISACNTSKADPLPQTPVVITMVVTATSVPTSTPVVPTATPQLIATETPRPTSTPLPLPKAIITYPWLNMRSGPGSWYPLVAELDQGTNLSLLAQYNDCQWLYVRTVDSVTGWVIANPEYLEWTVPCEALPQGSHRPATSIIRPNVRGGGSGELQINNETLEDSLVVLTWDNEPVYVAYIRSGETFYMAEIADGNYELYFCHGQDWNGDRFMRDQTYRRFASMLDFVSDGEMYTAWTVTLHGVNGGGTPDSVEVASGDFPW